MKPFAVSLCLLAFSLFTCQGSLSDEQKQKIKEEMDANKIQRITESEIVEQGFNLGRTIFGRIEAKDKFFTNAALLDSIEAVYNVNIFRLQETDSSLLEIEKQILEAYLYSSDELNLRDNVQITGTDSILYTKPITRIQPDGSLEFIYAIGIRVSKKTIIQTFDDSADY